MRTGDREPIPTVSEAVRGAAAICDPNGDDAATRGLIDAFEDGEAGGRLTVRGPS